MKNLDTKVYDEFLAKDNKEQLTLLKDRKDNGLEKAFYNQRILNIFIKSEEMELKEHILKTLSDDEFQSMLDYFKKDNIIKLSNFKKYFKFVQEESSERINKFFNGTSNLILVRNSFENTPKLIEKLNLENKLKLYALVLYTRPFLDVNTSNKPIIEQAKQNQRFKSCIITRADKEKISLDDDLLNFARLLELNRAWEYNSVLNEKRFPSHYISKIVNSERLLELVCSQPIPLWIDCIKNSEEIMKSIANIENPEKYFNIYKNLSNNNSLIELEELREKFYQNEFLKENADDNYIGHFFMRYFGDTKKNVKTNIEILLKYIESNKDDSISKSCIELYKDIFKSKSVEDFKRLSKTFEGIRENYRKANNINETTEVLSLKHIQSNFYDHFFIAREGTANSLLDNTFCEKDLESKKDEELSRVLGKSVYKFGGDSIKLFVHTCAGLRENVEYSSVNKYWKIAKNKQELETNLRSLSLSYITNKRFQTYKDIRKNVTFAFLAEDLNREQIATINKNNICSDKTYLPGNFSFNQSKQDLLSVNDFLNNDSNKNINEITYANDISTGNQLIPKYIVCADQITDIEKQIAKDLDIKGFILIDTKKYNYTNTISNPFVAEIAYDA